MKGRMTYIGVGFEVLDETEKNSARLHGPSSLNKTEFLGLGASTGGSVESAEGDASLVVDDLSEVGLGLLEGHTSEDSGRVIGVLETGADISSLGFDGLKL